MPLIEYDFTTLESCPNTASGNISIQTLSTDYTYSIDGVNFQNEPNFENLQAGTYTLQVQDANGCMVEESIDVLSLANLQYVVEDVIITCEDLEAELEVQVFAGDMNTLSVLWDDGSTDLNRTINQAGAYSVIVSDGCQSIETTVQARMEDDPNSNYMYVPNAFSPNDDGFNDEFHGFMPTTVGVQDYKLHIFDRWGNQVFLSEDPTQGWDGRFKGNVLSTGVFIWHMEATVLSCGQEVKVEKQGDVILMR
jgi:gliding motility-associated-like protein